MKTFALIMNAAIVVLCYISMFYALFQASFAMDAKDVPLATRYGVMAVFFLVYICWMDLVGKFKRLEDKQDAKDNVVS